MDSMVSEIKVRKWILCRIIVAMSVFITINLSLSVSYASDWRFTPSFTASEVYSDNINLGIAGREKGAFVTEVTPGISIRNKSARNRLNLDYRVQNLLNAGGNSNFDSFHQLQFNSNSEIIRNSIFLDLNSSIGQQNINNRISANDNFSGKNNRTDVINYSISPYWTPHFNGYANGEVRFKYSQLLLDNDLASDSENLDYSIRLNSGRRFTWFTWFIDHNRSDQNRTDGNDVVFQDTLGEMRWHINRYFNVFAQAGYVDNQFQQTTDRSDNGLFYSFGGKWKPNQRFSLEGAYGNNSFVTLDIMPTRHMHWVTTYRNNDKGINTGDIWESSFSYETKKSVWKASYSEETTTIQSELSRVPGFTVLDDFGNPVFNPVVNGVISSDTTLPTLNNEVLFTKKGEVSVAYNTGKSKVSVRAFSARTTFQTTQEINNVIGAEGFLDWRFTRRNTLFIRPGWQQITRDDSKDKRWNVSVGFMRRIPISIGRKGKLNAKIEYQYVNQQSNVVINEFIENRITANLLLTY
jgi:hypothetical protein